MRTIIKVKDLTFQMVREVIGIWAQHGQLCVEASIREDKERQELGLPLTSSLNGWHQGAICEKNQRYVEKLLLARSLDYLRPMTKMVRTFEPREVIDAFKWMNEKVFNFIKGDYLKAQSSWERRVIGFVLYQVSFRSTRDWDIDPDILAEEVFSMYNKEYSAYMKLPKWMRVVDPKWIDTTNIHENSKRIGQFSPDGLVAVRFCAAILNQYRRPYSLEQPEDLSDVVFNKVISLARKGSKAISSVMKLLRAQGMPISALSYKTVRALTTFIHDGVLIYDRLNAYSMDRKRIVSSMSLAEMVRCSGFNHRQNNVLQAEKHRELESDPTLMPIPAKVPKELEEYRIKTRGEMSRAGRECKTCIGGMSRSQGYVFYRKGYVCAQVKGKTIVQCRDRSNKTTSASKAFASFIRQQYLK